MTIEFTVVDYGFGALLAVSALLGALRGLVRELFGLMAWIVAAWIASHYAGTAARWLPAALFGQMPGGDKIAEAAGFLLLFIVIVLAVSLLGALLARILRGVGLSPADRSLGLAFGLIRGVLLVLVVAFALDPVGMGSNPAWRNAASRPVITMMLGAIEPWLPSLVGRQARGERM